MQTTGPRDLELVAGSAGVVALRVSSDGRILAVDSGAATALGREPHALIGTALADVVVEADAAVVAERLALLASTEHAGANGGHDGNRWVEPLDARIDTGGSTVRWFQIEPLLGSTGSDGELADGIGTDHVLRLTDVTRFKTREEELEYEATNDPLTGLPNRSILHDRIEMAMARACRSRLVVAVLSVGLDRFDLVNDRFGRASGDQLLIDLADRLAVAMRPSDSIVRLGGDEFIIVCEDLANEDEALAIAQRLNAVITQPFAVGWHEVSITASIGIAFADDDSIDAAQLVHQADRALYRAKQLGRSRYEVFGQLETSQARERLELERELNGALDREELRVFYQPTIDVSSGSVVGFEALLRWDHPERGLMEPANVIAIAEDTGLIVPIGAWILEESCKQAKRWSEALGVELRMNVNLSGRQLERDSIVRDVGDILDRTGLDPRLLVLELTESILLADVEASGSTLRQLKSLGVQIAVDDFGTGYSSLSYLTEFPVDILKIDGSFVADLRSGNRQAVIVEALIRLSRTLAMESTAEGVETEDDLAALRELGCDTAQGYFVSRPLPADGIPKLLATVSVG